jgi:predicted amidohydrolase YtcJ
MMTTPPTGLREAHAHLFQLGRTLSMVDLSGCRSRQEMVERLAERAKTAPGEPVLAHGARPEGFDEPGWPTADDLERACAGAAVWAWCFDHHALLASHAALWIAGIDASTPDPHGGAFERDAAGRLTGLCLESAALALWAKAPEPAPDQRRAVVKAACNALAALGFVEVHDMKAQPWLPTVLRELDDAGELPLAVGCIPLVEDLEAVAATRSEWESDRLRLTGGKVFVDGTLNSRTAWMLEPYADGDPTRPCGMALMSVDEVARAIETCARVGVPLAAHAIGDGAVRCVLDAIQRTDTGQPHRIEHAELIAEADIERFVRLGVVASVQPCHLLPDIEALERALPDRLHRVLPLRDLVDAGCTPGRLDGPGLVFGSDVPIVRADPGDSIQAAVHRTRPGLDRAIARGQALTEREAWACFAPLGDAGGS